MKLKSENTELRLQQHEMDAEGTCNEPITEYEVRQHVLSLDHHPMNIEISYDEFQSVWRWRCDIM